MLLLICFLIVIPNMYYRIVKGGKMDKPKVNIIKKNPRRAIPIVGKNEDVEQEIDKYKSEIEAEVAYIQSKSIRKEYSLTDGEFIYSEGEDGFYQFPNYQFLNFAPDTGATYKVNSISRVGYISYCTHEFLEICIQSFTEPIDSITMVVDSSRLLSMLSSRVENLDQNNPMLRMLIDEYKHPKHTQNNPQTGFESAKEMVENGFITMIWGPPGTGKTYTLANLALDYMKRGRKVLIMSQSNISVDGAILKIINIAEKNGSKESIKGKVFRYGMAREPNLYTNKEFCSRLYTSENNPLINNALEEVKNNQKLLNNRSNRREIEKSLLLIIEDLFRLNDRLSAEDIVNLTKIKNNLSNTAYPFDYLKRVTQIIRKICNAILSSEEDAYIRKASIIATTATKATISDKIQDIKWDVVFFDEVSMAFVPQIMVASTLAHERLVLLGDFRQLAPIVQFAPNSILRKDIFSYLHVTDGKGSVINHPWLVMLDEQRRMHPEIAEYVSGNLYDGKLKSGSGVLEQVQRITQNGPFEDKAFAMVDHSDFQALCYTTKSGSRFNPLSAIISIKLALKALEKMDLTVGIITPYQAQARLLSAIVDDLKKKKNVDILCSTVHQFQGFEKDLIIFDTVESEPKRDAGKIFIDSEYIDDATRLINVAITRTRGKFILVSNYNYLYDHKEDISKEMCSLMEFAKEKYWFHGNSLLDFITDSSSNNVVACYKTEEEAVPFFKDAIRSGNKWKKLSYWHSSRNTIVKSKMFSLTDVYNLLRESKKNWVSIKVYNGKGVERPIISKRVFEVFNPFDDYFVGEDTFVWFGFPYAKNRNYGTRLHYSLNGGNAAAVFEMLCGHEMARKELENMEKNAGMVNSDFSKYISTRMQCDKCGSEPVVKKTNNGKYIVVCKECEKVLSPYVPNDVIEDYIEVKEYRCKKCESLLKVGKYSKLFCPKDSRHEVHITVEDLYH